MRFGLQMTEDVKQNSRIATAENRRTWAALGFRALTAQVHDDDRELLLAELEVRKLLRLVALAEEKTSSMDTLRKIGQRNMTKAPPLGARKEVTAKAENNRARKEILDYLQRSKHYANKFRGIDANYNADADLPVRIRMEARAVAYNNLSASYFRLAQTLAEHAGQQTVFGLQGDGTPLLGDGHEDLE